MKVVTNGENRGMQFFRDGQRNEPGWQTWPTFPGFGNMGYRYSAPIQHGPNGGAGGVFEQTGRGTEYVTPTQPLVAVDPRVATEGPLATTTPPPVTAHPETQAHPYDEPTDDESGPLLPLFPGTTGGGAAPTEEDPGTTMENGYVAGDETTITGEEMGMGAAEEKPQRWPIYLGIGAGVLVIGGLAAAFIWGGK